MAQKQSRYVVYGIMRNGTQEVVASGLDKLPAFKLRNCLQGGLKIGTLRYQAYSVRLVHQSTT